MHALLVCSVYSCSSQVQNKVRYDHWLPASCSTMGTLSFKKKKKHSVLFLLSLWNFSIMTFCDLCVKSIRQSSIAETLFNPLLSCSFPAVLSSRCHSFYSKRYSRALYLGAKAIQLNSNSVQALLLKGAALRNMGRVQEAIIHFREAMRLAPCRLDCYEGRSTRWRL